MLRTFPPSTARPDAPADDAPPASSTDGPAAAPDGLAPGATTLVEAATAEQAIARVHAEIGPDARIVDARRERRGGIGGFFSTEVVQLHVADGSQTGRGSVDVVTGVDGTPDAAARVAATKPLFLAEPPPPPGAEPSSDSPVDRLLADADATEEPLDFATFLRQRMAQQQREERCVPHAPATDAPTTDAPVTDVPVTNPPVTDGAAADGVVRAVPCTDVTGTSNDVPTPAAARGLADGGVPAAARRRSSDAATPPTDPGHAEPGPGWSALVLRQLGLPVDLIRAVEQQAPDGDLAWTSALAAVISRVCRPLPEGPALLVGPRAERLESVLTTPVVRSRMWFDALSEGRWLHLVVGGGDWRAHLASGPLAVSWADLEDLPEALRCAVELDLVLGYGPLGVETRRARPLDVAIGIRTLVERT